MSIIEPYTLSLHDALPICARGCDAARLELLQKVREHRNFVFVRAFVAEGHAHAVAEDGRDADAGRSEEHTSELQSPCNLVCRLLLVKKKLTLCITQLKCNR